MALLSNNATLGQPSTTLGTVETLVIGDRSARAPYGLWFIMRAVAGQEEWLCRRLGRGGMIWVEADRRWAALAGVECWSPTCTIRRTTRRGVTSEPGSLFPGYAFLRLDDGFTDFPAIEAARGALGFMRHAGRPWPLLDQDMRQLRDIAARKGGIVIDAATGRELKDWNDLPKGAPVKITGGVWRGWNGLFSERVNGRIEVLLDLFGRATKTRLPEALVEPA